MSTRSCTSNGDETELARRAAPAREETELARRAPGISRRSCTSNGDETKLGRWAPGIITRISKGDETELARRAPDISTSSAGPAPTPNGDRNESIATIACVIRAFQRIPPQGRTKRAGSQVIPGMIMYAPHGSGTEAVGITVRRLVRSGWLRWGDWEFSGDTLRLALSAARIFRVWAFQGFAGDNSGAGRFRDSPAPVAASPPV